MEVNTAALGGGAPTAVPPSPTMVIEAPSCNGAAMEVKPAGFGGGALPTGPPPTTESPSCGSDCTAATWSTGARVSSTMGGVSVREGGTKNCDDGGNSAGGGGGGGGADGGA